MKDKDVYKMSDLYKKLPEEKKKKVSALFIELSTVLDGKDLYISAAAIALIEEFLKEKMALDVERLRKEGVL